MLGGHDHTSVGAAASSSMDTVPASLLGVGSPPQFPRGRFVAEKVSLFERRCQSPQNSLARLSMEMEGAAGATMPEALRSGPQGLPVPTPFSGGRRRGGECSLPNSARRAAPPDLPKPPSPMDAAAERISMERAILGMSP
mmetsp:Transcript_72507/g.204990  ORF Transcript_72507/g.204990 Transcript_72507/m.204990 type:complete len:140 (+) Transcript_72507:492-911(+)